MVPVVTVCGVSFEFPNGRELFHLLNFALDARITALVGPNGVGKSSLARLLVGQLEPTRGSIRRNASIEFFPQREAAPPVSVGEWLAGHVAWSPLKEKLLDGVDRQALCTNLSGGQWMRLRLARLPEDRYLILDEPSNDLDREGREVMIQFLRDHKGGVLLISHDRECLALCDDVLELSNQGLARFGGGWEAYLRAKNDERERTKRALETATRQRDRAKTERIKKLERQDRRTRRGATLAASGSLPKILVGNRKRRAQETRGKVDVSSLERAQQAVRDAHEALSRMKVDPIMYAELVGTEIPRQKLVAEARGFNVYSEGWLYPQDLNFSWRGGVRLALKGANGSGKSTLLKAILGAEFQTRGELRSGDLSCVYIDQRCAMLDDDLSVFENVRAVSSLSEGEIRNGLAKFLFAKETLFQKVRELSGGERLRAALACGLLSHVQPELLVLDEPTNNLDLANVEFLERILSEFRGALIVVSHDEVFLGNCGVTEEFSV